MCIEPNGPYVRYEDGRDKLIAALVAVCERGDTDHSAKAMYWIASDALKAAGLDSNGKTTPAQVPRYCICADPENCTEAVPGCICKAGKSCSQAQRDSKHE